MYISSHSIFRILKFTSLLFSSFLILQVSSQAFVLGESSDPFIVNIIPPSPEASALAKYADVPVSLYTGTPKITIPLYELNERDLNLPIFLSYHASAHKVEDEATRVGLGWTLNAGGVITRSIRGLPDEFGPGGFLHQASEMGNVGAYELGTDNQRAERYDAMARGCRDAEPDVFYYNFAGFTGKFQFDWDGNIISDTSNKLSILPIGLNPKDISFIQGWEIQTPNGIRFSFNAKATSIARVESVSLDNICPQLLDKLKPPQSWYLSAIHSPFTNSHITFDYDSYSQVSQRLAMETQIHNESLNPSGPKSMTMTIDTMEKYLKLISTSSGETTIEFIPGLERTDVIGSNLFTLGAVRVKNRNGTIVKGWELSHDYSTGRLTLKTVQEKIGNLSKPPYQFEYHKGGLGNPLSKARDHWGFPNSNKKSTLIPSTEVKLQERVVQLDGADRSPAPDSLNRAMIKKITYPAGGSDTFEFEPHEYSFEQNKRLEGKLTNPKKLTASTPDSNTPVGQVHSEIINFSLSEETDLSLFAEFTYRTKFGGAQFQPAVRIEKDNGQEIFHFNPPVQPPKPGEEEKIETETKKIFDVPAGKYKFIVKVKIPPPLFGGINSLFATLEWDEPVGEKITLRKKGGGVRIAKITNSYGFDNPNKVTKYIYTTHENSEEISTGSLLEAGYIYEIWMQYFESVPTGTEFMTSELKPKFVRFSQNRSALGTTQGSHVGYSEVTVINGENGENGKTVYKYTSPRDFSDFPPDEVPFPPTASHEFARGLLKEQTDFSSDSNLPVRSISNQYKLISKEIPGLKVGWMHPGPKPPGPGQVFRYAAKVYKNILGYTRLMETNETLNDSFGAYTKKFNYEYDEASHKQLTKQTTIDSDGKQIGTLYKYPSDYSTGSNPVITHMVNSHMMNHIIEKMNYKEHDGNKLELLSAIKNDYGFFHGNIRIAQVKSAKIQDPLELIPSNKPFESIQDLYETRLIYHHYDEHGNVLEHSQPNGMVTSYVWGENGTLPIAQVDNVKSNQIFYTSFENVPEASTINAYSGVRSLSMDGKYEVPSTSLPQEPGNYLLSYWRTAANGSWEKKEIILTGYIPGKKIATETINGLLDEVRLHPLDARMTTLTYEPLIGITSESDYNGLSTYYEYDQFGRLVTIRDHEKNILEHVEYHFGNEVDTGPPLGSILSIEGLITFLRAHDVGSGFGPASDAIDGEVIVRLDSDPDKAFGFTLRTDSDEEAHTGMFKILRDSFSKERRVRIEYEVTGINNNQILRVIGLP